MKNVINHWEKLYSFPKNILDLASSTIQVQLASCSPWSEGRASASFIYLFRISHAVDGKQCDTVEDHWNTSLNFLVSLLVLTLWNSGS